MAFMEPEFYLGPYVVAEMPDGSTAYAPADYAADMEKEGATIEDRKTGTLGRWSASGYMDCTDWTPLESDTYDAALREFCDAEDVCPRCFDQCFLDDEPCESGEGDL